jgi:hypothetical protein
MSYAMESTLKPATRETQEDLEHQMPTHVVWGEIDDSSTGSRSGSHDIQSDQSKGTRKKIRNRPLNLKSRTQFEGENVLFCDSSDDLTSSELSRTSGASQNGDRDDQVPAEFQSMSSSAGAISQGSLFHDSGNCKPCSYYARPKGCMNGARCEFCHLWHEKTRQPRSIPRPCKGKRKQIKDFFDEARSMIDQDPLRYDVNQILFPSWLEFDEWKEEKARQELSEYWEEKLRQRPYPSKFAL